MLRASLAACLALAVSSGLAVGCGPKVPKHAGYKTKAPWKKAKAIELDDQFLGSSKGELDYGDFKRAKWLTLDIPDGNLQLDLEFTPTDEAGDATVAMEILDSGFNVISQDEDAPLEAADEPEAADDEEGEDDEEDEDEEEDDDGGDSDNTQKQRILPGLAAGKYYIHLFVTKRLDTAEYKLKVAFTPVAPVVESTFPKDVAWVPALPIVPLDDDAPAPVVPKDKDKDKDKGKGKGKGKGKVDKDKDPPPEEEPVSTGAVEASIIDVKVSGSGSGTDIVIGAGSDQGLAQGRKGSISGVKKGGSFTLSSCGARTCKASVSASVDEVNRSKKRVTIK